MSAMTKLTIIVATDSNNGIGINNTLPWHLPEDLAHFKRLTSGHPIIMGRKTFDSIGRPLPNRRNIVISRNADWRHEGVERVASLEEAQALVAGDGEAFVIGGAQVYQQALPLVDKLVITRIGRTYECDAFFPALPAGEWREVAREEHVSAAGLPYSFISLIRN
jgi:dihydrofolate reductase